jgi:lipid II:glycine glycyltransferase (peptidoglycan interpeptide bridge formation enzyme)
MNTVDVEAISRSALDTSSNLFQSSLWAGAKARLGEEPLSFRFRYDGRWYPLLVVVRPLGEGYRAGYIPWGPDLQVPESEQAPLLEQLAAGVAPLLPDDVTFLRFDLPWQSPYQREGEEEPPNRVRELRMNFGTESRSLRKAPTDVQPTDTLLIDPRRAESELLSDMRAKTRYNIRLARRRGVVVEEHPHADLAAWYELYRETMERKELTVHEYRYFEALFRAADMGDDDHGELKLLLARRGEELLAGMVLALYGDYAVYLYGASSDRRRPLMPAYRLQWRAIQTAAEAGCRAYDMFGIPGDDSPSHPMHGLLRFKSGFGGRRLTRRGCWDYPFAEDLYREVKGRELADGGYYGS